MNYHPNICPFYLIQMLSDRAQLFLTDPRITSLKNNNDVTCLPICGCSFFYLSNGLVKGKPRDDKQ